MPFVDKPQTFAASIQKVTIGTGDSAMTLGGSNVCPLYSFDAPIENPAKVGLEISDLGYDKGLPELAAFYAGCETLADQAAKAAAAEGVSFVALRLDSADPNGENASVDTCAAEAKAVCEAIDKPLVIMGCKNVEKDSELFNKISEALQGKNVLLMSAKEENYKTVGASAGLAYNQKIGAESSVDINLAKQLNVLFSQLGVSNTSIVMNVGSAAAGYGFEYVVSTMDRIRAAALTQNDVNLQMPIITPVGGEAWGVKEALAEEADMPAWGAREERGIQMEIATAASCLASGSDAVIMRHPAAAKTVAEFIAALM